MPYRRDRQEPDATTAQARWIDRHLPAGITWGVSSECGLGRVPAAEVLDLIDLHRTVLDDARR